VQGEGVAEAVAELPAGHLRAAPWQARELLKEGDSQVALGVHGLTDAVTWGMVRPEPFVWILWGISFGVYNCVIRSGTSILEAHMSEKSMRVK
jgi:hypothetical protein